MALALAASFLLCLAVGHAVSASGPGGQVRLVGFDGIGVIGSFILFVAATWLLGSAFAISLLAAMALHELGHVLAHRSLGNGDSRFRMLPFLSGLEVAARPLRDDGEVFYVAIMGAGFSLAPMAVALSLSMGLAATIPDTADFLLVLGSTIGAFNFLLLLPFLPLDGGRCAETAARTFWPTLSPGLTAFMCAALAMAAIRHESLALMFLAGVGAQSLFRSRTATKGGMSQRAGLIALAAYGFTFAAHFTAGWLLFSLVV